MQRREFSRHWKLTRPHAGTFTEASTNKRPTIKKTKALVTSEAHGQPWARDSSHRVCIVDTLFFRCIGAKTDQPALRADVRRKLLLGCDAVHTRPNSSGHFRTIQRARAALETTDPATRLNHCRGPMVSICWITRPSPPGGRCQSRAGEAQVGAATRRVLCISWR
jgi:hypothetical protein